jgi:hypothetical protein
VHALIYEGENCMRTIHARGGKRLRTDIYQNRGGKFMRRVGKSMPDTKNGNSIRSSVPDPDVFGSQDPHPEPYFFCTDPDTFINKQENEEKS